MKYIGINEFIKNMKHYHIYSERQCIKRHQIYNPYECQDIELFKKWCKLYDIKDYCYDGYDTWVKVDSKKRNRYQIESTPLQDHAKLFRTSNKDMIFITQPYANLDMFDKANIIEWANERGLEVEVSKDLSWHFPKETLLIQYTLKDKAIFDSYIDQFKVAGHRA